MNASLAKMSFRERVLFGVVAGTVFLMVNLFGVSGFFKRQSVLKAEIVSKRSALESAQRLVSERGLWEQRDAWLKQAQPTLTNQGSAGVELLDHIKEVAKNHSVNVLNPALGSLDQSPVRKAISVSFETKSPWPALIEFLHELQQPDRFLVLEKAGLEIDPGDATQIRGTFKASRWYKPGN